MISGLLRWISRVEGHEKGIFHEPRFMEHAETYLKAAREFDRSFG